MKRYNKTVNVSAYVRQGKDKLIPVRQHNRTIGYVKERALTQMMQPAKKVSNDEFRQKVEGLKMRPIDEQVDEGLERLESEKKGEKKGIFDDLLDSFSED